MAPLPSWSWAGWQCLVDPDSLKSGLHDIARRIGFTKFQNSWRTGKLVDWSTLSNDRSATPIDEPALLQTFKAASEEANNNPLPAEWSRKRDGAFSHASDPEVCHLYPLPTQNTCSATIADRNISLLSCTTRKALLRIRRVLIPYDKDTAEWKIDQSRRCIDTSVFDTDLYHFKPKLQAFCPVLTLEDGSGRWAGAMAIMEDKTTVHSGSELELIAISTGSAFHRHVASSYPEKVDSTRRWSYRGLLEYYQFRPLDGHDDQNNDGGRISVTELNRRDLDAGIDVGPFAHCYEHPKDSVTSESSPIIGETAPTRPHQYEQYELFHFYNVLWVENIGGVMYRKAAGGVPKEIWEQNCGEPTEIVLG